MRYHALSTQEQMRYYEQAMELVRRGWRPPNFGEWHGTGSEIQALAAKIRDQEILKHQKV